MTFNRNYVVLSCGLLATFLGGAFFGRSSWGQTSFGWITNLFKKSK